MENVFGKLGKKMRDGKDKVVSATVKAAFGAMIEPYGDVHEFSIDSAEKKILMKVMLRGELEMLDVYVYGYKIEKDGGESFIAADNIMTSREWLTQALGDYGVGKKVKIPDNVASAVSVLL